MSWGVYAKNNGECEYVSQHMVKMGRCAISLQYKETWTRTHHSHVIGWHLGETNCNRVHLAFSINCLTQKGGNSRVSQSTSQSSNKYDKLDQRSTSCIMRHHITSHHVIITAHHSTARHSTSHHHHVMASHHGIIITGLFLFRQTSSFTHCCAHDLPSCRNCHRHLVWHTTARRDIITEDTTLALTKKCAHPQSKQTHTVTYCHRRTHLDM